MWNFYLVLCCLSWQQQSKVQCDIWHTIQGCFPLLSHILYPINPFPPSILDTYNLLTLLLGCNSLFTVMTFCLSHQVYFLSILQYLHHLIKETTHVFIAMILFLPLSIRFMINFVLVKYSLRKFSFILLSLILLYSKIPRYLYLFFILSLFSVQVHHTFLLQISSQYHYLVFDCGNQSIYFTLTLCKDL